MIHKLEADSISIAYGNRPILSDVYIKCETGKVTGLLGRNGNGKTTLMNIIYGNGKPNYKSVRFDDVTVNDAFKRPELILYLPQFNFIPSGLTLKTIFQDFNLDFEDFENRFPEFIHKWKSTIKSLSGGQRRLVEVYVIIKSKTQFVMLDEPFSHLSPIMVESILEMIEEEKSNKGFLITDHYYRNVVAISDDIYVLVNGKTHLTKDIREIEFLGYAKI